MAGKILVIEDNRQNRSLLKDVLNYYGYEVIEAENGKVGTELAREHRPGLILMDIQMPVMDGLTATRILKSDPETKDIAILSLSSFSLNDDAKDFLEAGFDGFVPKPIDIRTLPELVKKYLGE